MRRVLLFAAFLLLLGLTTATAASFDVQAEDIATFSTDVSISVPTTTTTTTTTPTVPPVDPTKPWYLFGEDPAPGGMSTDPEEGGPHKWDVYGSAATTAAALLAQTDADRYYVWSSGPLPAPLNFKSQTVTFSAYLTSGGGAIYAALLDCPRDAPLASADCGVLGFGGPGMPGQNNVVVVDLGTVSRIIPAGNELRLKIVNGDTRTNQFWKAEWGYKTNREANLTVGEPSP